MTSKVILILLIILISSIITFSIEEKTLSKGGKVKQAKVTVNSNNNKNQHILHFEFCSS